MRIVIMTSVRLLGDGLAASLGARPDVEVQRVVPDLPALRRALHECTVDLALIDVTQGVDLEAVRSVAGEFPNLPLLALGLDDQRHEVIRCGRAGFSGYVGREADVQALYNSLWDVVAGRQACPSEVSGGLLRALFRGTVQIREEAQGDDALTRRERDVLQLVGRAMSNKEIARELGLSVATVKHHVHHILEKMQLQRRGQAMRRVRGDDGEAKDRIDGGRLSSRSGH